MSVARVKEWLQDLDQRQEPAVRRMGKSVSDPHPSLQGVGRALVRSTVLSVVLLTLFLASVVAAPLFAAAPSRVDSQIASTCVADNDTLCLVDGRFQVEVDYRTKTGAAGSGTPVLFTDNAGLFWFFNGDNFEMLFKLLDGCTITNHYWVFFAATTNVGFTVTVTDTDNGAVKVYDNAIDDQANAITDTGAFETCPGATTTTASERFVTGSGAAGRLDTPALEAAASDLRAELASVQARRQGARAVASPVSESSGGGIESLTIRSASGRSARVLQQIPSAGILGPTGTTYEPEPLLGTDIDGDGFTDLFTLQPLGGTGNVVTFDGVRELLKAFDTAETGLTTVPRMNESIEDLGQGLLRIVLTMDTRDADDLFPSGFTAGQSGPALDMAAIALGLFGGDPLDFPNNGVKAASFELFLGQTSMDRFDIPENELPDFFPLADDWDGTFGVVFDQVVGLGINRVVTTIEVQVANTVDPFDCVEDTTTQCRGADGRFQIRGRWQKNTGETGDAVSVLIPGSESSGLFYYFDPSNLEMLVKVLDGCSINSKFWVFFAATTNVFFELEVIDSDTGVVKVYTNPLGQPADAITDTQAFACP